MVLEDSLSPSIVLHGHDIQEVEVNILAKTQVVEREPALYGVADILEDLGTICDSYSHTPRLVGSQLTGQGGM